MERSRQLLQSILVLVLVMGLCDPAAATNISWRNAVSGSWHVATNWNPSQVPGPGDVAFISLSGTYTVSINSNASAGAIALSGGTGTRRLNVNGATLTTGTGIAVGASNILGLNSGTVSGAGTVDLDGTLTSSGNSAINSPVLTHTSTTISIGPDSLKVSSSFANQGMLQIIGSTPVHLFVNGTLTNASSGTIESSSVGGGFHGYLKGTLNNQGTVTVAGDFILDRASADHANTGSVSVAGSDLTIRQTGTSPSFTSSAGILFINTGRTLNVDGGDMTVLAGSVNGNGLLHLTGNANADFSVFPDISVLNMQNATAVFPGTFNTNDTNIDLEGSDLTANVTNALNHTISIVNSTIQGTVINSGSLDIRGNSTLLAFLYNEGLITIHDGLYLSSGDTGQQNHGIIRVLGGTFAIDQTAIGYFTNNDTLAVSAGVAEVVVTGGEFRNEVGGVLTGGAYDMTGTVFINDGTISPGASPGAISLIGNVTLGPTSVLNMELGGLDPGTTYDLVIVSGHVVLNGTLNLSTVNGFVPQPGDVFDVMTCGTHSGQFTTVNGTLAGDNYLVFVPQTRPLDPIRLKTVRQSWTNLAPSGTPPAARTRHSTVYDGFSNRLIIFGGRANSAELNDTWVLTNANGNGGTPTWQQLPVEPPFPPARQGHMAAHDVVNNRLIVYGGYSAAEINGFSDVWVLSHANGLGGTPRWTQLSPGGGTPGARVGGGVGYNPASNRLLLFGGVHAMDACPNASNDVWILTNANGMGDTPMWSVLPATHVYPNARSGAVLAYDDATNRLIVHAGTDACAGNLSDVRYLTHADGTGGTPAWNALLLNDPAAPGRTDHAGFYDAMTDRLVTFGGLAPNGTTFLDDVFLVTGATDVPDAGWCRLPLPAVRPVARMNHSVAWDPMTRRVILFGGDSYDEGLKNDVWTLNLDIEPGAVSGVPGPRVGGVVRPGAGFGFERAPWPNPTRQSAAVSFRMPAAGFVTVDVFNVAGRHVEQVFAGTVAEGVHEVEWNGTAAASGVYYFVVRSGGKVDTRGVVVVR